LHVNLQVSEGDFLHSHKTPARA